MSDPITIRVVCEGPTDFIVIRSIVEALGIEAVVTQIQPEDNSNLFGGDAGELGGGWKGVRRWCKEASGVVLRITRNNANAVVIHSDADIAEDREHDCVRPCPPASDTADLVRQLILGWLGVGALPAGVVLCVPSWATEAWVLWALFTRDAEAIDIECRQNPAALLVPKEPKLVVKKGTRYRKVTSEYRHARSLMKAAWMKATSSRPGELDRFLAELKTVIL